MPDSNEQTSPGLVEKPTVLIADDTPANLDLLARVLEDRGYDVLAASTGERALRVAATASPLLILLDIVMTGIDGYETCRQLKADHRTAGIPVIFISAREEIESVVAGFEAGGVDYISKPFQAEEVIARVGAHVRLSQLTRELGSKNVDLERQRAELASANAELRDEVSRRQQAEEAFQAADGRLRALSSREAERWDVDGFIGKSKSLGRILADVKKVRNFGAVNVLITGESGTGKELIARAIHSGSPRAGAPFIPVNCVAVPEDLAESAFFGHLRGSFTGATSDRKGYFELADKGTLFLDEIGDMPVTLQAKLLRVLEDGRFIPVGSQKEKQVDVRVVAATNANLQAQIASGAFRQDLYFRLAQFCVEAPALRDRREDLPLLVSHFVRLFAQEMGTEPPTVEPAVLAALARHDFPGNVRELKNIIERCLIQSGGQTVRMEHLQLTPGMRPTHLSAQSSSPRDPKGVEALADGERFADLPLNLQEAEAALIKRALAETGGNVAEAARRLGINRTRIYRKMGEVVGSTLGNAEP